MNQCISDGTNNYQAKVLTVERINTRPRARNVCIYVKILTRQTAEHYASIAIKSQKSQQKSLKFRPPTLFSKRLSFGPPGRQMEGLSKLSECQPNNFKFIFFTNNAF